MTDESRRHTVGGAAWLEPHDPVPNDMDAWLREWGLDPARGIDTYTDAQGWKWFVEKSPTNG